MAAKASPAAARPIAREDEQHRIADQQPLPANPQLATPQAVPSATPANANWMWDPKRPGSLDRPGHSATPAVFTKHIYYTDDKGKKYWLDAQGKRHYE